MYVCQTQPPATGKWQTLCSCRDDIPRGWPGLEGRLMHPSTPDWGRLMHPSTEVLSGPQGWLHFRYREMFVLSLPTITFIDLFILRYCIAL